MTACLPDSGGVGVLGLSLLEGDFVYFVTKGTPADVEGGSYEYIPSFVG